MRGTVHRACGRSEEVYLNVMYELPLARGRHEVPRRQGRELTGVNPTLVPHAKPTKKRGERQEKTA